ncbi:efflux RND transporter permease subunit [Methylococcaceae bacterium WWC4]|nr:efflux RND transporter permease subunit [Methylococcaceae bacterium WWC4]
MNMRLDSLYRNHVLANLSYLMVLILGGLAYPQLPKEKAPDTPVHAASIAVALPGAGAEDVERLIVDPIERTLRGKIRDIKHVSSNAQTGIATITVSFEELDKPVYERRMMELRRELQTLAQSELPKSAAAPDIFEGNLGSDWFKILVYGPGEDENFRRQARQVKLDLQRMPGVATVETKGLEDPELQVVFHPERLAGLGISPTALADTVSAYFRDIAAGVVKVDEREWLLRLTGTEDAASRLAQLPILGAKGEVRLGDLADISRASKAVKLGARFRGQPAVAVMPIKQAGANTLTLIDQLKAYIDARNRVGAHTGVQLFLLIDQSDQIRNAIATMEEHAWSGMLLVWAVTWLLLGTRLSLLTTLAVPFSLAGVFIALQVTDQSLNLSVLLGVIIVLGMLVDDAVVVIEAVGQQLRRGLPPLSATVAALREVWLPVATSSLTTIATFVPLMLMSGYLGILMGVVPQVVCLALLISIVQALWILPAHAAATVRAEAPNAGKAATHWRERMRLSLQRRYGHALVYVLRRPIQALLLLLAFFAVAGSAVAFSWVKFNWLPTPPDYGFVVTLEMASGTPSAKTLATLEEIERRIAPLFEPGELRASAAESGAIAKEGQYLYGHQYGDLWFSLNHGSRDAAGLIPSVKPLLTNLDGAVEAWVEGEGSALGGGVGKAINLNIQGGAGAQLDAAVAELKSLLAATPGVSQIRLDRIAGLSELKLRLDSAAIQRAGLSPDTVSRTLQLLADGESVASYAEQGEPVGVRVRAYQNDIRDIGELLRYTVARTDGSTVPLGQLVSAEPRIGPASINHIDYQQMLTLQADLDKSQMDTLAANGEIQRRWEWVKDRYPDIKVSFGGEMETVEEGLKQLWQFLVLGLGLIFIIVGAQFQSYGLPLLVLLKIPMAFAGVILGLMLSGETVSLYTFYGAVALAGIAVNSAILMFSAAHDRLQSGMGVVHASIWAARRRLLPILITSLTTTVGLLPLALSEDQSTSAWRPVATAIVWGVGFSTLFTLFLMPLLYRLGMAWALRGKTHGA